MTHLATISIASVAICMVLETIPNSISPSKGNQVLASEFIMTEESLYRLDIEAEKALLLGDWLKFMKILEEGDSQVTDPIERFLMGHATLATNNNNASTLFFLSTGKESELKMWLQWSEQFLERYPQNYISLYFAADAKVRNGQLQEAISIFTQVIKTNPNFVLARNARGVAYVMNKQLDHAVLDFYQSMQIAPNFADAHANYGALAVLQESSIKIGSLALDAFNKALQINPDFSLAFNGRGCLHFGSGEFELAAADFNFAAQLNPFLPLPEINQGFASVYGFIYLSSLDGNAHEILSNNTIQNKYIFAHSAVNQNLISDYHALINTVNGDDSTLQNELQQYQVQLQKQQQDLIKNIGKRSWNSFNESYTKSSLNYIKFVKKYGLNSLQQALFIKRQDILLKLLSTHYQLNQLEDGINFGERLSSQGQKISCM